MAGTAETVTGIDTTTAEALAISVKAMTNRDKNLGGQEAL